MQYTYIASGHFGSLVLEALNPKPFLVITQPDKLGGRGMKTLLSTEVKKTAQQLNISCIEVKTKNELQQVVQQHTDKVMLLSDFGLIIPAAVLSAARYGIWNIHPSLLPHYRGATPIQSAILNGEKQTGVSVMQMDELVDHGVILAQSTCDIDINDTALTLMSKLAKLGAESFMTLLSGPQRALQNAVVQNHDKATFTKKLTKDDGYVQLEKISSYVRPIFKKYNLLHLLPETDSKPQMDTDTLHNRIRALSPWPGVWTKSSEKIIKLTSSFYSKIDNILSVKAVVIEGKTYSI